MAVLILDAPGDDPVISEVDAALLGSHAARGAVLEVPLGSVGEPVWEEAVVVEE